MQFLTSLIGGSGNMILNAALALGVVLVLIVLALWGLKLVMRASNNVVRAGKKRLALIDVLPVDGKRRLLIVRRDNVEHLILTGGPQDVVVEAGIAIEAPAAMPPRPIPAVRRQMAAEGHGAAARAPLPQRAPAPRPIVPAPSNDETPTLSPLDRLRGLGRTAGERRPASLRHTGLMRQVNRMEPGLVPANADNSVRSHPDSATTGRVMPFGVPGEGSGQAFGGDDSPGGNRDEGY